MFRFSFTKLALFLFSLGIINNASVLAAEKITLQYSLLEFTLSVKSLETFSETGKIDQQLANYTRNLSPEKLQEFRKILQTKANLDPVTIANFLNSIQGEIILQKLGQVIQTNANINGFYALRSALILAAADENGLTPLNILKKFPTSEIKIVSEEGLKIFDLVTDTIKETTLAIASIEKQAITELNRETPPLYPLLDNIKQQGDKRYSVKPLILKDIKRDRQLAVDLYLPEGEKVPLMVISHGLGSDRSTFAYLAQHLASWGLAVVVLEHPESNGDQIKAVLNGFANSVTPPEELINRPLDVKFILNELEFLYSKEINVQRVGIIGQSFGGYTSLALAGAELNQKKLSKNCEFEKTNKDFNTSLLLQCLALKLPEENYNLKDERIVAAIAINPLTSAIFGEESLSQIKIPIMIMSGSDDTVTPALTEQIIPFTWLKSEEKYLVLMKGGTHFSTLNETSGSIPVPSQVIGPDPSIAQEYVKALSLAFFATYIEKNPDFKEYLNANYAQYLSKWLIPLKLVTNLELTINN